MNLGKTKIMTNTGDYRTFSIETTPLETVDEYVYLWKFIKPNKDQTIEHGVFRKIDDTALITGEWSCLAT